MCRNRLAWSLTLLILATATVAAQNKPDFSGRWILAVPESSAPDIPSALLVRQTVVRTTVHGEPMEPFFKDIAIDLELESGVRSENHLIGMAGGIVPGRRPDSSLQGLQTHYCVNWEDSSLVFENGSHTGPKPETGVWAERRETWSLDPEGRLRIVIVTRSSADDSRTVTLVYRRP
jgi:hypothetical protein